MTRIHHHYDQLTQDEKSFVDKVFDANPMYYWADVYGIKLANDDRIERAVDALARTVVESRPRQAAVKAKIMISQTAVEAAIAMEANEDRLDNFNYVGSHHHY